MTSYTRGLSSLTSFRRRCDHPFTLHMLKRHHDPQVPIEELHEESDPSPGIRRILQNTRQPRQRAAFATLKVARQPRIHHVVSPASTGIDHASGRWSTTDSWFARSSSGGTTKRGRLAIHA